MTISAVRADTTRIVAVCGVDPVGEVALHDPWPVLAADGYLYAALHGSGQTGPVSPAEVLVTFLSALGVRADRVPPDLRGRTDLYRVVTSNRRLLVVLDNAVSAAQVRPLLPLAGTAVVTSRWTLTGLRLDGARVLSPGPLNPDGVVALLAREFAAHT